MLNVGEFDNRLKKPEIDNCYILAGSDEKLLKDYVEKLKNKVLTEAEQQLNLQTIDGEKFEFDQLLNACETMPFMAEKRVVSVYRADFLSDSVKDSNSQKNYEELKSYIKTMPKHAVLIMYYVFESERGVKTTKIRKLEKDAVVVKVDKPKGANFNRKVQSMFKDHGVEIGGSELALFCSMVDNNFEMIEHEITKLKYYKMGQRITSGDIIKLISTKKENDIFNLVDSLSRKNIKEAVDVFNELISKGEEITPIFRMVQRQYNLLFNIKTLLMEGKNKDDIAKEMKLHPYVCEKMIGQSKKFSLEGIVKILELSLDTERNLKSLSTDKRVEVEMFMVETLRVK